MKKEHYNFSFIIDDNFPYIAFTCASECIRVANLDRLKSFFDFKTYSINNNFVQASNGKTWTCDGTIEDINETDYIFLFTGENYNEVDIKKVSSFLRVQHHKQIPIVGIGAGAFILAEAGLLNHNKVVVHWKFKKNFQEKFPNLNLVNDLWVANDNQVNTCAGALTMLDFMLDLIKKYCGATLSNEVKNHFIHDHRYSTQSQREEFEFNNLKEKFICKKAIAIMEDNIEFPLKISDIAFRLGLSIRTLEREFIYSHAMSPIKFYLKLRLNHAKNFLSYENYKINIISGKCGFNYNSVFNNAFKKEFKLTPKEYRNNVRKNQNSNIIPEIKDLNIN